LDCEPVAVAVQFQDVDVVSETVEQSAGEPLGAEDGRPFLERQVGSDDDKRTFIVSDKRSLRPALVTLAEDLEEKLGAGWRQRHISQLIDDQQLMGG
jgi:hypothetical protein